ncbi:MAG: DUF4956 domain-containing protein [Clostridia bacterium]|nr:DUF4956 domain-containing protein [Clostridia bacterium]
MLNNIFTNSILTVSNDTGSFNITSFLLCTLCSIILGIIIASVHGYKNHCSKGFATTLALLPAMVQVVIMLVNGNLGTGVAIMGAFGLVRFRSVPGSAKDIASVFLAMASGLATGTGYLAIAVLFVIIIEVFSITLTKSSFGENNSGERCLKITIPESLDYSDIFTDLFQKYTTKNQLLQVRTTNMGALYNLNYQIELKAGASEKEFIDELRCRNGNLEISCGRILANKDEL